MQNENKLGVMPIKKLIWNMSLPIIISMLVQALYNIVDSVFVSWVSEASLTAVSLAFPAQNLMISLAAGTAVGVNALMGRALGAKDQKRADTVAMNGLFLALVGFALCAVLGLTLSDFYFRSQTDVEEIIQMGNQYLMIVMGASFGAFGQMMLERLLQGTGHSILSMYTQGAGAIINIILDPIMIFGLLGCPAMGIAGAAIATVIGQIGGMTLGLVLNQAKNVELRLHLKGFRPNKTILKGILDVGFPSIIMQSISSVMNVLMNMILLGFGAMAVNVLGVYFKLQSFVFMPVFGLSNGLVAILGYNYGARMRARVYDALKVALIWACVIMLLGTIAFLLIPETLLSLFEAGDARDLTDMGVVALRVISLSFLLAAVGITISTLFQAVGKGMYSLWMSLCRQIIVLLPVAWLLSKTGNVDAVWWSFPIAELFSVALCLLLYRRVDRNMLQKL